MRKGEWIILDTYYAGEPCCEITYPNGYTKYIQTDWWGILKDVFLSNKKLSEKGYSFRIVDACKNPNIHIDQLVKFLKDNWGDKIIVINTIRTNVFLDYNGKISNKDVFELYRREQSNHILNLLNKQLDCYIIEIPQPLIGDQYNDYDVSHVHYIDDVYHYLKHCVDNIVSYHPKKATSSRMNYSLYLNYSLTFNSIYLEEELSRSNFLGKVDSVLKKCDNNEIANTLSDIEKTINKSTDRLLIRELEARLARCYRDGRGVSKDLNKAAELMRSAAGKGLGWAKWEYFEILSMIGTPESLKAMIEYGQSESDNGNMELRARLARCYRDGRGVPRNLRKAADLMKETHSTNPQWSKWEYIDILWMMNTPETDKEMFEFAKPFAERGQKDIQGRLGRMYRDGRGVKKDLVVASEWMRRAADQNLIWAKNELFDILWAKKGSEVDRWMYLKLQEWATLGNEYAIGYLAKCYHDGSITSKNLDKAIELMDSISSTNLN